MQAPAAAMLATVHGQVQGIGFRYSTRRVADNLGLSGWVRNLSDGSVEVWAEGSTEALRELRVFLEQGPPGAVVEAVEVAHGDPRGLEGFQITF